MTETPEEMCSRLGCYTDLELKASVAELFRLMEHYRSQVQVLREAIKSASSIELKEVYGSTPYDSGEFQGLDILWNGNYVGFIQEQVVYADDIGDLFVGLKKALAATEDKWGE